MKEVRDYFPKVRIVVVSGHEEFSYAQQAILHGVSRYILKPIDRTEVVAAFEEIKASLSEVEENLHEDQLIQQVDAYIKTHIDQDITLTDVAKLVHLHPTYFSQWFKDKSGKNFSTYVTERRLKRAETLLDQTNLRIYEIARMSGYQSQKHFMKLFKKEKQCTPTQYRKKMFMQQE